MYVKMKMMHCIDDADDSLVLMVLVKDSLQINDGAAHP